MSKHISVITTATLRVAGEVAAEIRLNHAGTREREASLRMGEVLIFVRSASVATGVADLWHQAKPLAARLPHYVWGNRLHLPARAVGMVGMMVRFDDDDPACTVVAVPGVPGTARLPHIRVEVGPLVWQVCDAAAWHSIDQAWTRLARILAATGD